MSDRYDLLAPRDIGITMRSMPRRFSEALGPVRADPERWAKRDATDVEGNSLTSIIEDVGRHLATLEADIAGVLRSSEAVVSATSMGTDGPPAPDGPPMGLDGGAALIDSSAEAIAASFEKLSGEGWAASARQVGGGSIDLIDLARHAARVAAEGLRAAQTAASRL